MARNSNAKGFNKFLNFIGLVDVDPNDPSDQEFEERSNQRQPAPASNRRTSRSAQPEPRPTQSSGYTRRAEPERTRAERTPDYSARTDAPSRISDDRAGSHHASGYSAPRATDRQSADRGDEFWRPSGTTWQQGSRSAAPRESTALRPVDPIVEPPTYRHQTVIFRIQTFEECREVIIALIDKKSVLLNLDQLEDTLVQRAIDTLGGAAFAIGATMRKASDKTYLIAPSNVVVANSNAGQSTGAQRYM